jgi:hypothetical protein
MSASRTEYKKRIPTVMDDPQEGGNCVFFCVWGCRKKKRFQGVREPPLGEDDLHTNHCERKISITKENR